MMVFYCALSPIAIGVILIASWVQYKPITRWCITIIIIIIIVIIIITFLRHHFTRQSSGVTMYIPVGRMVSAGWSPWRQSSRFPSWPSSPWSPPTEGGLTRVWWPPSTGWGFYWFFQFPNQFIIMVDFNREKQHTADWRQNAAKANRWGLGWLVEDDFTEKASPAWDDWGDDNNCSGRMVREASLSTGRRGRGWSDTGTRHINRMSKCALRVVQYLKKTY